MNGSMILRLARKDWHLQRIAIGAAFAGGALALALLAFGGEGAFTAGLLFLITVVIGLGVQLAIATIVQERADGTLVFTLSLPVSARDVTAAKLVANLGMFLLPWTLLGGGAVAVFALRDGVPDGLIPVAVLVLVELLLGYCVQLAVALVTESMGWTIAAVVAGNLAVNGFLYRIARIPEIAAHTQGAVAVWNPTVFTLLGAMVALAVLALGAAWVVRDRRGDLL